MAGKKGVHERKRELDGKLLYHERQLPESEFGSRLTFV